MTTTGENAIAAIILKGTKNGLCVLPEMVVPRELHEAPEYFKGGWYWRDCFFTLKLSSDPHMSFCDRVEEKEDLSLCPRAL